MIIIGGGIAGLSLAHHLDRPSTIFEKDSQIGGLCRSYDLNGIAYDIGPHIIFSKDEDVLAEQLSLTETNTVRRSNQIIHDGRYVKFPFENDLSALDEKTRDYCLTEFLHNPYADLPAQNMLQFFLKTFGEGITRTYLQPYNEKIWKFDPSFMDTQMVERIPKPPPEDVINSAKGIPTDGYLHQLFFNYPKTGGFQSLVDGAGARIEGKKAEIRRGEEIRRLEKSTDGWIVHSDKGRYTTKSLVSCIPLHVLFKALPPVPQNVSDAVQALQYNSIHIVVLQYKKDTVGDHFALYFANPDIIFHRLSKLNFLGEAYCLGGDASTLVAEITFRPNSYLSSLTTSQVLEAVVGDLENQGMAMRDDLLDHAIQTREFAYVIYDINHRRNTDLVLEYLESQGIYSLGRFAEFEYVNSDQVIARARKLAQRLNKEEQNAEA